MKITKTQYLHGLAIITMVLALVRCASGIDATDTTAEMATDSLATDSLAVADVMATANVAPVEKTVLVVEEKMVPHRIWSVPSFKEAFPDSNSVQLASAEKYGVKPVRDRADAERRKTELVYVGYNPYFHVDRLRESIPYLVPRASVLLQDIGRAFYDSLYVKGVPLHQIIVTSVLRSEEDIERLRKHNLNASENSCHRFGTTMDICYNRYVTVQTDKEPRRQVQNDTLKWVLSEVLRDKRQEGRCYVKYERKQGCFHITVR